VLLAATAAPAHAVKVPLPSAGDFTLAHLVFKPSAAHAGKLPKLRLSGRAVLRRYRVAVVGGAFRLSRKRVVGSALLMRKRPSRRVARTPRAAAARITANAPIASATVERNAIADLRRERAHASGEEANAPSACGETGLFSLLSGDTIPPGNWSFGLYYNNWDRIVDFSDPMIEHMRGAELLRLMEVTYGIGCGDDATFGPGVRSSYNDLIRSLGAQAPGPSCGILTTYVGPATDGEGHILTQPLVNVSLSCSVTIQGVTITIPDHLPTMCRDSVGNDCTIQGNLAIFPFDVPGGEDRSYSVATDPPLERGLHMQMELETPQGVVREDQVM
jgi:hypothetical protein